MKNLIGVTAVIISLITCANDGTNYSDESSFSLPKKQKNLNPKLISEQNTLTLDTINSSYLGHPIILKFPINIDTSYIIADMCGNSPKCKKYISYSNNTQIELCQYSWPSLVTDDEIDKNSKDYDYQFDKYVVKAKSVYDHQTDHKVIAKELSTTFGNWKISGLEILSDKEDNTVKLSCVNTRHMLSTNKAPDYDVLTTISIECIRTKKSIEEITDWANSICENFEFDKSL